MIDYETIKKNALNEINELTSNKIKSELSNFKVEDQEKLEKLIENVLRVQINPIFEEVIIKNKTNINNKINEYKDLDEDDIQYKLNEFINSSLSIWKKTILNTKILFSVKEVITYIKLSNNIETNYKKKEKQEKQLKKLISKYRI